MQFASAVNNYCILFTPLETFLPFYRRAIVQATPTASPCSWSGREHGETWSCPLQPRPFTNLMMMGFTRLWGSIRLPSASSRRGPAGSTLPTPIKKSTRSKRAQDTAPLWATFDDKLSTLATWIYSLQQIIWWCGQFSHPYFKQVHKESSVNI